MLLPSLVESPRRLRITNGGPPVTLAGSLSRSPHRGSEAAGAISSHAPTTGQCAWESCAGFQKAPKTSKTSDSRRSGEVASCSANERRRQERRGTERSGALGGVLAIEDGENADEGEFPDAGHGGRRFPPLDLSLADAEELGEKTS